MDAGERIGLIQCAWAGLYLVYFAFAIGASGDYRWYPFLHRYFPPKVNSTPVISPFVEKPLPAWMRVAGVAVSVSLLTVALCSVHTDARKRIFAVQFSNTMFYCAAAIFIYGTARTLYRQMSRTAPPAWVIVSLSAMCGVFSVVQFTMLAVVSAGYDWAYPSTRWVFVTYLLTAFAALGFDVLMVGVTLSLRKNLLAFVESAANHNATTATAAAAATAGTAVATGAATAGAGAGSSAAHAAGAGSGIDTSYVQRAITRLTIPVSIITACIVFGFVGAVVQYWSVVVDPLTIDEIQRDTRNDAFPTIIIAYFIVPLVLAYIALPDGVCMCCRMSDGAHARLTRMSTIGAGLLKNPAAVSAHGGAAYEVQTISIVGASDGIGASRAVPHPPSVVVAVPAPSPAALSPPPPSPRQPAGLLQPLTPSSRPTPGLILASSPVNNPRAEGPPVPLLTAFQ